MTWLLTFFLRPIILIVLFVAILYPARLATIRYMREGKLKRLLLRRVA